MSLEKIKVLDTICYKRNFITEAICKVDFLNPIDAITEAIPKEFSNKIKDLFPIAESKVNISNNVLLEGGELKNNIDKSMEWSFWNKERNRRIAISKYSMVMVQKVYESYENFKSEFELAFESLNEVFPNIVFKRFGVRYINNINLNEPDPLDWKKYINDKLIASIEIVKDKNSISRALNNLELNYEQYNLRFAFGIFNPDYPAKVKKKSFILDLDAYSVGMQSKEDVYENLGVYHSKIQQFFEYSIKEELKEKYLNNG